MFLNVIWNLLAGIVLFVIARVVAAMAVGDAVLESDGDAVTVQVISAATIDKGDLAYIGGWIGIVSADADSGDYVALDLAAREYQFTVPAGLSVSAGDTVYIETALVTAHIPPDAAYSTSSGAGKVAVFKATAAKDGNNVVTGILRSKFN